MKIIESKGNATLLAITKKNNKKLWNKLTRNGEIWEHYKDTIANNRPEVIAVKYGKKVIPLIGGRPSTSEKRIPQFRIQSAWANKAIEVEVKKTNYICYRRPSYRIMNMESSSGTRLELFHCRGAILNTKTDIC